MKDIFYITTPIYYPSSKPHMGHAYSSISADVIARYKRLEGYDVKFVTGTDEHGQKIEKSARKLNLSPIDFCNNLSNVFLDLTSKLYLSNTDFIRTTEKRHVKTVKQMWKILHDSGYIYLGKYSGWYSVSDEAFYTESEIEKEGELMRCISTGSTVEWLEEDSYFFKLSSLQDALLDFYNNNPNFIEPAVRRNEVISFVKSGLNDLSISRTSFKWGIPVPNNSGHIVYVWLDALTNYITASNYFDDNNFWPADLHIIGKDILRFHAIYWPAFLIAAKIPLPKKVFGHGWILSGEQKMSKSKGNILDPIEIVDKYGLDEIRYYLMKEVIYGLDGKINLDNLANCINSDLANNIGNLSQRTFTLVTNNYNNYVPEPNNLSKNENILLNLDLKVFKNYMEKLEIHNYVREIISYSSKINKYINDEQPWSKIKNNLNASNNLFVAINALKNIFILLHPIIPMKSEFFLSFIGISKDEISFNLLSKNIEPKRKISAPGILFKKLTL